MKDPLARLADGFELASHLTVNCLLASVLQAASSVLGSANDCLPVRARAVRTDHNVRITYAKRAS